MLFLSNEGTTQSKPIIRENLSKKLIRRLIGMFERFNFEVSFCVSPPAICQVVFFDVLCIHGKD